MGGGKGKPLLWVSLVKFGTKIFEIGRGFYKEKILKIFREVSDKLGIRTKVCLRRV
jgi:ribosomal protein L16/L10AE